MRHHLRKVGIILGFSLLVCGIGITISPRAEASYGVWDALETIGISTGIGTVLGLSTLAFYESPSSHSQNVFMGAGGGLLVGLGVAAYLFATDTDSNGIDPEELLPPENKPKDKKPETKPASNAKTSFYRRYRSKSYYTAGLRSVPATLQQRGLEGISPRGFSVAVNVLELRF